MGGDGERLAYGYHAGAADAGHQHAEAFAHFGQDRFGDRRQIAAHGGRRLRLSQATAVNGDEARTEAFDAGEILVAARLIDAPLAPEFGFQRLDRHAVGDAPAIAAALADFGMNEGADGRVGPFAALAQAPALS